MNAKWDELILVAVAGLIAGVLFVLLLLAPGCAVGSEYARSEMHVTVIGDPPVGVPLGKRAF